jgi:polysaccharide pyruvyl transferase WcaK-like protein
MKTLFIGAYGFGNLGDELVLKEAIRAFPSEEVYVRSVSKKFTSKFVECDGFISWEPSCPSPHYKVNFDRVVIGGGGILNGPPGHDYMSWIVAAQNSGAETIVHNVGAAGPNDPSWMTEDIKQAFEKLKSFSVRDTDSLEKFRQWGVKREIELTAFPETYLPKDMGIADKLPEGKYLGVSVNNGRAFFDMVTRNKDRIREIFSEFEGHKIIPIVSTVHLFSEEENDIEGFKRFRDEFFPQSEVVLLEMLDRVWWYENMSPERLKGLISRCDVLFSRRKHNCVHAIACGVRTMGLSRKEDYGVQSVFDSLKDSLPTGSSSIRL